jgi:hypothetical protein
LSTSLTSPTQENLPSVTLNALTNSSSLRAVKVLPLTKTCSSVAVMDVDLSCAAL